MLIICKYFFSPKLLFLEVKNIKPIFPWKVKNMKICSNHENLRTIEAQTKITGSYKNKLKKLADALEVPK